MGDNELVQLTLITLFYTTESFGYMTTLLASLFIVATFSRLKEKRNWNNNFFFYSDIWWPVLLLCDFVLEVLYSVKTIWWPVDSRKTGLHCTICPKVTLFHSHLIKFFTTGNAPLNIIFFTLQTLARNTLDKPCPNTLFQHFETTFVLFCPFLYTKPGTNGG